MQAENDVKSVPTLPEGRQRVVIVGNGISAWFAAAMLARSVAKEDFSICVVADGENDAESFPFGPGDATLPVTQGFLPFSIAGEDACIAATRGAFTFGIAFSGWSAVESSYFHPFGSIGAALGPAPFPHLLHRLRGDGVSLRLANYSLAALAAQAGRFARPGLDAHSVLTTCDHGLHLPCKPLTEQLQAAARSAGVVRGSGIFQHVERNTAGDVAAVAMDDGQRVGGDWFLDCTQAGVLSAGDGRACERESWSDWLPCDRFMTACVSTSRPPPPYSHAQAHRAGWIRHLPIQGQMLFTEFHRSNCISEDEALAQLKHAAGSELSGIRSGALEVGRRIRPWSRNCITLGAAAASIDPVGASNLHLLRPAMQRLLGLLPATRDADALADEYNRQTAAELDGARDFAVLNYKLNGRSGDPMWNECRDMAVPSSLEYKIRLYESRGIVAMYDEEFFEEIAWINLFDENGVRPRQYKAVADGFSGEQIQAHVGRVRAAMIDALAKMPTHAEYLAGLAATVRESPRGQRP
jgi:tryptophan halogenase